MKVKRIAQMRTAEKFKAYLDELGVDLPFDEDMIPAPEGPLAQTYTLKDGFTIGNRFAIHPMEGWDGTKKGKPTDLTRRRWRNFGASGAKLIWGGEAVAIRHDGRANPNQLLINRRNRKAIRKMREEATEVHESMYGTSEDLMFGLQLTHSGRFSRPNKKDTLEPMIAYRHPVLDKKFGIPDDYDVLTDKQIEELISDFVDAVEMAHEAGFKFVDVKHCHGYLGHEFLSAYTREGKYGGTFENRTRFLKEIVAGIRAQVPEMRIGVRVSAFDFVPFMEDEESRRGKPHSYETPYPYVFGASHQNPMEIMLDETIAFLGLLHSLDVEMVNLSCASPYYNPHFMRPALFPPSDGYLPPEDPLVGVARQLQVVAKLKAAVPGMMTVGTGYSYLQEWLPNVAQYQVRNNLVDFVGVGRMVLSYPEFPADIVAGKPLQRKLICRTFSDCTTAPRNGMISGCFPLDDFYKGMPEAEQLKEVKQ